MKRTNVKDIFGTEIVELENGATWVSAGNVKDATRALRLRMGPVPPLTIGCLIILTDFNITVLYPNDRYVRSAGGRAAQEWGSTVGGEYVPDSLPHSTVCEPCNHLPVHISTRYAVCRVSLGVVVEILSEHKTYMDAEIDERKYDGDHVILSCGHGYLGDRPDHV